MKKMRTIGLCAASAALAFSLAGCGTPTVEKNDDSDEVATQEDTSGSSNSGSKSSTSSSYNSGSSSSSKSSGSYSSSSKSSSTDSGRRETYSHTDSDGYSYMEYSDGSAEVTDGWGNVGRDTDGDGSLDLISTDGGESWDKFPD